MNDDLESYKIWVGAMFLIGAIGTGIRQSRAKKDRDADTKRVAELEKKLAEMQNSQK